MSTVITFSPPDWIDAELVPETVLGGARSAADDPFSGRRVSIGRPQVRPLRADDPVLDEATRAFVAATQGRFHLVQLYCSLFPGNKEDLESAGLSAELSGEAVSWSLAPLRLSATRSEGSMSVGATVSLSPFLKINGTWAPDNEQDRCWIWALGEGENNPEWRMRRTADQSIKGPQSVSMVVHSTSDEDTIGTVAIAARFASRGLRTRYSIEVPNADRTFVLAG